MERSAIQASNLVKFGLKASLEAELMERRFSRLWQSFSDRLKASLEAELMESRRDRLIANADPSLKASLEAELMESC